MDDYVNAGYDFCFLTARSCEDTVKKALKQIEDKKYDTGLISHGIKVQNIYHYGFAFEGKNVLIG